MQKLPGKTSLYGIVLFAAFFSLGTSLFAQNSSEQLYSGIVVNQRDEPLADVSVQIAGSRKGVITEESGTFEIPAVPGNRLLFSLLGYKTYQIELGTNQNLRVVLEPRTDSVLGEVVVIGYGTKRKEEITSSIATLSSDDISRVHGGSTVSTALAGKMPGVSFRMPDGRPGASANIQIRGLGNPLFIIDDIQQDAGQFNNLAPDDIESITVLKDAAASIYGSRAANGVVLVKTKQGKAGQRNSLNVGGYYGVQNWSRFPHTTNAYEWMLGRADADLTFYGRTNITPEELEKWKDGTGYDYYSEDWRKLIVAKNAPQYSMNVNATGGTDRVNYYISATHLDQAGVYGTKREFKFSRTNIQSNIDAKISNRLKVGVQINGRIETRDNPGVPEVDDYWNARFALFRNRPTERAYANNNPAYPNDIGHNAQNFVLHTKDIMGYWRSDWRVVQMNFNAEYKIPGIEGLTARGKYSYYLADNITNGHEYTYDVYAYHPDTDTYEKRVGSSNPYRERINQKVFNNVMQVQLDYDRSFGDHHIAATFVNERIERKELYTFQHAVPKVNYLPILFWNDMDGQGFNDRQDEEARVGYVLRASYNYASKYYLDLAGRRDASWKFAPDRRVGYFPSASVGWRLTNEPFFRNLIGEHSVLNELKIRGSYGILGDDNVGIGPFDYMVGYQYNVGMAILNGVPVTSARLRNAGIIIDNVSWFESRIGDVGIDFGLFNNKLTGGVDYFYRKRTGLLGTKYDILLPSEIGYGLPQENVNSDARFGGEFFLNMPIRRETWVTLLGVIFPFQEPNSFHPTNPFSLIRGINTGHRQKTDIVISSGDMK